MDIKIVTEKISVEGLRELARNGLGEVVKGVVDIKRGTMALGGKLHSDANEKILESGSSQEDVWGFNVYPDWPRERWIECVSLINIRPAAGNRSMEVQDPDLRQKIIEVVNGLIV